MKCEIDIHAYLSAMEVHKMKSPTEIIILVLNECWDLKKRRELYHSVHGIE